MSAFSDSQATKPNCTERRSKVVVLLDIGNVRSKKWQ